MIRSLCILFFVLFVLACKKKKSHTRKFNADKIVLAYRAMPLSDGVVNVDERTVVAFNEIFDRTAKICECIPTGTVRFYSNDSMILNAEFATSASGSGEKCQFLIVNEDGVRKCYQLNYSAGMFLDEVYNDLKRK